MDSVCEYLSGQLRRAKINRASVETKWENNREHFIGVSPDVWKSGEGEGWRSKAVPGYTHQKCVFALAIVCDMVLSGGAIPFMFKPSGFDKNRVRTTGPVDPKVIDRAIKDMSDLTRQQLVDCKAEAAMIKNVLSAALYGWTYAKFIIYNMHREGYTPQTPEVPGILDWKRLPETAQQWVKWEENFMAPGWDYVPVWDIYRDWETDDLQECAYIGQRKPISAWWLRQKKGKAYFIDEQIDFAISKVGSSNDRTNPSINNNSETQNLTPILRDVQLRVNDQTYFEYWGRVPRNVVEAFEKDMQEHVRGGYQMPTLAGENDDGDEIEVCASTMNDTATVRFCRTLPSMRPYVQAKWEDPGDELAPRGIADNCREMHNVLTGIFRAIEDNEKLSANVIIAIKERLFKNMPKELTPGLKLLLSEDCDDARKAIQSVTIPSVTGPLMQLLGVVQKFLDDDSMVPRIAEGIKDQGDQTAAEASMRQAASQKYLGSAIRNLDQGLIEPMVKKFYDHNMADPAIQTGKGNYIVQALGFTSFMNKTERIKNLQMVLAMTLQNPEFLKDTNTKEIRGEIAKALDCDPDQFLLSEDAVKQNEQAQAESPPVKLAEAQAGADVKLTEAEATRAKAQAVKALADAKGKVQTMPHPAGPGGEPSEPGNEGGQSGLEASSGGGAEVGSGAGAGQPAGDAVAA